MWLRRLVGLAMIISFFGMNGIMVKGLLTPDKKPISPIVALNSSQSATLPTVSLTVDPSGIATGSTSALNWSTTGNATSCTASGGVTGGIWAGDKTPFGAESTGRINNVGDYTFTITCSNLAGKAQASAKVSVTATAPTVSQKSTSTSPTPVATYCNGRLPCYGPKEVSSHGSSGNCWGWNGDRVINISGFDPAFHQGQTGISSIEASGVCGKDLAPSLNGSIGASGSPGHDHRSNTKSNADSREIPYFVGYFDSSKP